MTSLQVVGRNGGTVSLEADEVQAFRSELRGSLLLASDPGYDEARVLWNGMIDRRPAAIVRCLGVADVIRTVNLARDHRLLLAVHAGGHSIAGKSTCDGGVVLDVSLMRDVRIDPRSRTARVAAGALLGDLDHEAQAFGLAVPTGVNSTTGIAGLTLGGGTGWLTRKHGLSIDNLISADVVTAKGELVRASETEEPDLFWGIRGGGGNLGVATSFEFQLHPVGPQVLAGFIIHRLADAGQVLRHYRSFIAEAPEELSCWAAIRKAPPLPFLPAEFHGTDILLMVTMYLGDMEEGAKVLKPMREFGKPIADVVGPTRFVDWQKAFDPLLTPGARNYWKSHNFTSLSDGLIETLIAAGKDLPSPLCELFLAHFAGAANRVAPTATAYPHRDMSFLVNAHIRWEDPAQDEVCVAWGRKFLDAAGKFATGGVYLNFLSEGEDRVRAAYGVNYDRLVELKNRYDPENIFRSNINVPPTHRSA
jgi:FAD/FMN-containing dehydrogenase